MFDVWSTLYGRITFGLYVLIIKKYTGMFDFDWTIGSDVILVITMYNLYSALWPSIYIIHLITSPLGNRCICFPENLVVCETKLMETSGENWTYDQ